MLLVARPPRRTLTPVAVGAALVASALAFAGACGLGAPRVLPAETVAPQAATGDVGGRIAGLEAELQRSVSRAMRGL